MKQYQGLLQDILVNGDERIDRTGTGTKAVFGRMLKFNLQHGFPAVTTKKLYFESVAAELAGFLEGTKSAERMRELGTNIWDANANAPQWQESDFCKGPDDMGPVYGYLWRNWYGLDQLKKVCNTLKTNPYDRRMIVTAWLPHRLHEMCLPPCHIFYQFSVSENKFLNCGWYIRSVDTFLGMPFDIASYALLMHIVAQTVGLQVGEMTMFAFDTHLYLNHLEQAKEQLSRQPYPLPELNLDPEATIDNFHPSMARLAGYNCHPAIKAEMSV